MNATVFIVAFCVLLPVNFLLWRFVASRVVVSGCDHCWREVSRSWVPPCAKVRSGGGWYSPTEMSAERAYLERLVSGSTVVGLRCSKCGDVASRTMLGKHLSVSGSAAP